MSEKKTEAELTYLERIHKEYRSELYKQAPCVFTPWTKDPASCFQTNYLMAQLEVEIYNECKDSLWRVVYTEVEHEDAYDYSIYIRATSFTPRMLSALRKIIFRHALKFSWYRIYGSEINGKVYTVLVGQLVPITGDC